tara:strand:+ start:18160 stop:18525 length:366 start_codon:yes stop_codon:yes gene_type:complete
MTTAPIDDADEEIYTQIKLEVMKYHIQVTLDIAFNKLSIKGKTIGDLPIPAVELIGEAAFAELVKASDGANIPLNEVLSTKKLAPIFLSYDDTDRRDFSSLFRQAIMEAASNSATFSDQYC